MNVTTHLLRFRHATAGNAEGSVSVGHVPFVGPMTIARIAYESSRNPALLESPCYHSTFPATEDGRKRALRALRMAASRQGLAIAPKFMVELRYASGWADAEWTEDEKPLRFGTREAAQTAIEEHVKDMKAAVKRGDMQDADRASNYRVVEVAT